MHEFQKENNIGFLREEGNSAGLYLAKLTANSPICGLNMTFWPSSIWIRTQAVSRFPSRLLAMKVRRHRIRGWLAWTACRVSEDQTANRSAQYQAGGFAEESSPKASDDGRACRADNQR